MSEEYLSYVAYLNITNDFGGILNRMVGGIMQNIELLGLPEKQEKALKGAVKKEIRLRQDDFVQTLASAVPLKELEKHGNSFAANRGGELTQGSCDGSDGCRNILFLENEELNTP